MSWFKNDERPATNLGEQALDELADATHSGDPVADPFGHALILAAQAAGISQVRIDRAQEKGRDTGLDSYNGFQSSANWDPYEAYKL